MEGRRSVAPGGQGDGHRGPAAVRPSKSTPLPSPVPANRAVCTARSQRPAPSVFQSGLVWFVLLPASAHPPPLPPPRPSLSPPPSPWALANLEPAVRPAHTRSSIHSSPSPPIQSVSYSDQTRPDQTRTFLSVALRFLQHIDPFDNLIAGRRSLSFSPFLFYESISFPGHAHCSPVARPSVACPSPVLSHQQRQSPRITMNSQGANDVSPEAMQARIQQARREAETLKDRIKRKKDELSDTTRTFPPIDPSRWSRRHEQASSLYKASILFPHLKEEARKERETKKKKKKHHP